MPVDDRSMATRLQASGSLEDVDFEMFRRKSKFISQAKVNGSFDDDSCSVYSPKGLLPAKYFFLGELELNQFDMPNSRKFWRCGAFSVHEFHDNFIFDYEMNNISTLLASESLQIMPNGSKELIGFKTDDEKLNALKIIKKNIVEVVEQVTNSQYDNYYPVKWKFINKKEFIMPDMEIIKTLTVKKYEQLNDVDIVSSFRSI